MLDTLKCRSEKALIHETLFPKQSICTGRKLTESPYDSFKKKKKKKKENLHRKLKPFTHGKA